MFTILVRFIKVKFKMAFYNKIATSLSTRLLVPLFSFSDLGTLQRIVNIEDTALPAPIDDSKEADDPESPPLMINAGP